MKKEDVPQDHAKAFQGRKKALYALDENGRYAIVPSSGWEAEEIVLDQAIEEYERWHKPEKIWPSVIRSLRDCGIRDLELYRCGNRLVQVLDVPPEYSFSEKDEADSQDPDVRAWEELMWRFQVALPFARAGEKWVRMTRLFSLRETLDAEGPLSQASDPTGES